MKREQGTDQLAAVPNARLPTCPITQPSANERASVAYLQGGARPPCAEEIAAQPLAARPALEDYPQGVKGWTDARDGHQEKRTTSGKPAEPVYESRGREGQAQGTSSPNFPLCLRASHNDPTFDRGW